MHAAQCEVPSVKAGVPAHSLTVGTTVEIFSGHSNRKIGVGTVLRVLSCWVVVQSSSWRTPVKFRTCAPLRGHRITGGVAEYLNEWISVPVASAPPTAPSDDVAGEGV